MDAAIQCIIRRGRNQPPHHTRRCYTVGSSRELWILLYSSSLTSSTAAVQLRDLRKRLNYCKQAVEGRRSNENFLGAIHDSYSSFPFRNNKGWICNLAIILLLS